jgi:hypothetical protein
MHRVFALVLTAIGAVTIAAFALSGGTASAHEVREVGDLTFIVGFANEPAFEDFPNSIDLIIEDANEVGVEGLEETLQAEVIFGGGAETRELPLEAAFGEVGVYHSWFIPVEAGEYTFHVTGEAAGQQIDESFTSGPETFSVVESHAETEFPQVVADNSELQESLDAIQAEVDGLDSGGDDSSNAVPIALGMIAIAIGVVALGVGAMALRRSGL